MFSNGIKKMKTNFGTHNPGAIQNMRLTQCFSFFLREEKIYPHLIFVHCRKEYFIPVTSKANPQNPNRILWCTYK